MSSATLAEPLFIEHPDEVWEFVGDTFEDHVDCWQEVDGQVQKDKWKLSSIAASLDTKYKDDTVNRFAHEIRRSASYVRDYAQTYRAFENNTRVLILSFRHHLTASRATNPVEAINRAHDGEWSYRELEYWIKTGIGPDQKRQKKPPPTPSPEMQKLHDDAVRAELEGRIAVVRGWTEPVDPILSTVYHRAIEMLEWQRDRTVDRDCAAIITMLAGDEDDEDGAECASLGDMHVWLKTRCLIMSERDVKERVQLMLKVEMLQDRSRNKSKGKKQRGVVTPVYEVHPGYWRKMSAAVDANKAVPTASELLKAIEKANEQPVSNAA